MKKYIKIVASATIMAGSLTLISCGGGGGGNTASTQNATAFLSAAPVDGAVCVLYSLDNGVKGAELDTQSSNQGNIDFINLSYQGEALIECTGGQYLDEATQTTKDTIIMRSVINFENSGSYTITPLTEIAYQLAPTNDLSSVLSTHNNTVAKAFGLCGVDISQSRPKNINKESLSNDSVGRYGTVLTLLSQLEKTQGTTTMSVINNFATDLTDKKFSTERLSRLKNGIQGLPNAHTNINQRFNARALYNINHAMQNGCEVSLLTTNATRTNTILTSTEIVSPTIDHSGTETKTIISADLSKITDSSNTATGVTIYLVIDKSSIANLTEEDIAMFRAATPASATFFVVDKDPIIGYHFDNLPDSEIEIIINGYIDPDILIEEDAIVYSGAKDYIFNYRDDNDFCDQKILINDERNICINFVNDSLIGTNKVFIKNEAETENLTINGSEISINLRAGYKANFRKLFYNPESGDWSCLGIITGNILNKCGSGIGSIDDRIWVKISWSIPSPQTPSAPTASVQSTSQIDLYWLDATSTNYYRLYNGNSEIYAGSNIGNNSFNHTGLSANTTYSYRLKACTNSDIETCSSASLSKNVTTYPQTPQTPSAPTASVQSSSQINLLWSDVAGATYYRLYNGNSEIYAGISNNYNNTGLTANTTYSYTLKACANSNVGTCSTASSVRNATTQEGMTTTPIGLKVVTNSTNTITLSWDAVNNATRYEIYRHTINNSTASIKIAQPLASSGTSYIDTELNTDTVYYYWLKSCNNSCSEYSNNIYAYITTSEYTKLGFNGIPLTIQNATWTVSGAGTETLGTKWSCVKDNNTNLVWEVKTNSSGIHHKNNRYKWGGGDNSWTPLVTGSNNEPLCSFNNWRVPNRGELRNIIKADSQPRIDTHYFPNTNNNLYWSSSQYPDYCCSAYVVYFADGTSYDYNHNYDLHVRLVRSGQ